MDNSTVVTPVLESKRTSHKKFYCACIFIVLAILALCSASLAVLWGRGDLQKIVCDTSLEKSYFHTQFDCSAVSSASKSSSSFSQDNTINIDTSKLENTEELTTQIVEKVTPAVVTVVAQQGPTPDDVNAGSLEGNAQNIGSGFIVRGDGLIVTNSHVVSDDSLDYSVIISSEKSPVKVDSIYRDTTNDIALLKINKTNLPSLKLGDSDALKRGNMVIAIGSPLGDLTGSVTSGIISGLNREVTAGDNVYQSGKKFQGVIQTDAPINPGNSGGPLINSKGEVVGLNFATTQGADNISFALPINRVKAKLAEFQANGKLLDPFIGVAFTQRTFYLKDGALTGALVSQIQANSPAAQSQLKKNDLILSVDGKSLESTSLLEVIQTSTVGSVLKLEVWRASEKMTLEVKVGNRSDYTAAAK